MAENSGPLQWRKHSLVVQVTVIVVMTALFLYAGTVGNPLAMRAFNLVFSAVPFLLAGRILKRDSIDISIETAAAVCLLLSGLALTYSSAVGPLEGMIAFGDNETLATDIGFITFLAGLGLSYLSDR